MSLPNAVGPFTVETETAWNMVMESRLALSEMSD